jgi:hypothetical protein
MSLKPLKETVELWQKISRSTSLEESLRHGSMSSFLLLEDSVEAINSLNQQIDQTMGDLKALAGTIPKEMSNTKSAIQAAIGEVSALRLKPDPKIKLFSLGDPVKAASKVMANAASLSATIVAAGQTIMGSMNDLDIDTSSAESLKTVLGNAKAENDNVPDEKAFVGAVKKAWQPPKGVGNALKGFFSALGMGAGSDFFGLTAESFASDLMNTQPKQIMAFLTSGAAKDSSTVDEKEVVGLDDKLADAGLDKEALSDAAPGDDTAKGGKDDSGTASKKWSDISAAYLKTVDDQPAGKKLLDTLKTNKAFGAAVADLINLEESMYRRSLSSLLFEAVEFDVLKAAAASASDDEAVQVQLARGLAQTMSDQGIEVKNVPAEEPAAEEGGEAVEGDMPSEKEAKAEQENAQAELQQAVKDEVAQDQTPASAALGAIDSWVAGLSKTSQASLTAKKRTDGLKQAVQTSLDQASKAVEKQVAKAIQNWRGEHEDTLMKSKRFAKKNFDSLQSLVPKLAAAMLKKSNESSVTLTVSTVNKTVNSFLDKKFAANPLLSEHLMSRPGARSEGAHSEDIPYTEDDMVRYRWLKMAGLGK